MSNDDFDSGLKVGLLTLLDSLKDKDDFVIDSIHKSLCKIAIGPNANKVLTVCCNFKISKKKLESEHTANILRVLEQICMQQGEYLESDIVGVVIDIVINEMTSSSEYVPLIQMPASGILVAIGNYWCAEVIEPLGLLVKPGVIPHYTVIHTLGTLAATNINGTVPFIKPILGKMLPTLGMIKQDPLKQAFSYALGHFSTALIDFFGNNENQDNDLKKNNFSTEISISFDVLHLHWLTSSEPKVVENVLEAMGPMFSLLPSEKMKELVPKLIPAITALYKKTAIDSYFITQSLTLILIESVKEENLVSMQLIESMIQSMFHLILTSPDYDQPQKIKNHFELLRCFDIFVANFSECVLEFLFQQTKNNNDEEKMKSVIVLTHLITSSETSVKMIVGRFTTVLKAMIISEQNLKMKRIILKAIVALAYRRYLDQKDDAILLDFIISQCSTDNGRTEKMDQSSLTMDCENSLYLLSSTVPDIKSSLWPLLLKALLNCNNDDTLSIISRCLTQLVNVEQEQETVSSDPTVPSNESIYVRSLSLLINHANKKMAQNLVLFLLSYSKHIHKGLVVSWEMDLQKLSVYLDSNDFSTETWESLILDLFKSAMFLVNDNKWIEVVLHKILEQIPKNEKFIQRKGILYKFLAILLCNIVDSQTIGYALDILFNALANSLPDESKNIARALGIISIKHGLSIVEKLDTLSKDLELKKSSRFLNFNFMKNVKHENDANNMKYSVTLCYGEVAKEALDESVIVRLVGLESEGRGGALRWAVRQLRHSHPPPLLQAALSTIELLAKAINSSPEGTIILQDRWNLVNLVLDQMFEHTVKVSNIEMYPPVIKTITALIILPKPLAPEERNLILRTICTKVYNSVGFLKTKFGNEEEEASNDTFAKVMNDTLSSLNTLIKEFMLQSVCPSTLDDILSILDEWIDNENEQIRTAVIRSVQVALMFFIQNIKLTYENPSRFGQAGLIMGKMVPRCADVSSVVRYTAIDCVKILIQTIDLYEGRSADSNKDIRKKLSEIQGEIGTQDLEKFTALFSQLANIISECVPHQQTIQLIESLLSGLYNEELSGLGCNLVLSNLLKTKGQDLHQNVNDVMHYILQSLISVDGIVRKGLLNSMLMLARHHPKAVITYLLLQPLPFEKSVNDCWRSLAHDVSLSAIIVDQLCQIIYIEPLFEESLKYDNGRVVSVQTLAIISALSEMFSEAEVKAICMDKFNEIFSMLYTILPCFIGADAPAHAAVSSNKNERFGFIPNHQASKLSPARIVLDTFKYFLINANCGKAVEAILQCTQLESGDHLDSFLDMVASLVEVFSREYPQRLASVVSALNVYSRATFTPQRIAVAAFFSHLVAFRCNDNMVLLETVMATVNTGWKDTTLEVRAISLSGLSNIRCLKDEQREHYLSSVLVALYNGLDDYQGNTLRTNIPLVSIIGLNGLLTLPSIKEKPMTSLPPISQRIKSFFNTENPLLREASIQLFGDLVLAKTSDDLREQALALFPCFLLHLADDDTRVVKVCKQTLKKISPIFEAQKTNNMIQNHLIDSARLHLVDFTIDVIKNISVELPKFVPLFIENTFNYLNSPWDSIRSNAALIAGVLFSSYNVADESYEDIRKLLTSRLLQLMKDSNSRVRASTATALSALYQNNTIKSPSPE